MKPPLHLIPFVLAFVLGLIVPVGAAETKPTVFAAASLTEALSEVAGAFEAETGIRPTLVFAGSSTLARQIENGAQADIFLSADLEWMDYLDQRDLIQRPTRKNLLGNRLVLIAPVDSPLEITIVRGFDLAGALRGGKLSIADPDSVPAGRYAKQALLSLGLWGAAEPSLVRAENVRIALAYVARREAPLGIVYATDAKVEPKVKIAAVFPEDSHPPILYPVALTANANTPEAKSLFDKLGSAGSVAIFERFGFAVLK